MDYRFLIWVLSPILFALSVVAQSASQYYDPLTGVPYWRYYDSSVDTSWGFLFPPLQPTSSEFIGFLTAPLAAGWVGVSLGGAMRSNPLLVGWLNGNTPVLSSRFVAAYAPPTAYAGPILTVLGSSGVNGTHQRIVFRCQNCTTWTGGTNGIDLNGNHQIGFAIHGSIKPLTVADANSELYRHTYAGQFTLNTAGAHASTYQQNLQTLQNAPPLAGGGTPTTTTPLPTSTANSCPGAPQSSYALTAASGWRVVPLLGRLSSPRGIAFDTQGHLAVVERNKGVTIHVLDANGCVTSSKTVVQDNGPNHGIDFSPAGNKLYASSSDIAWVWDYDPIAMTATNKRTLVTGMNNNYHFTRTILISRKNPNLMVLTVGSNDNIDMASFQMANGRASIKVFDLNTLPANGIIFNSTSYGKVMGYGLRNDVGVAEDRAGLVYSIENSLDNAYRTINGQNRDIHTNNPAEKVYRLGDPANPSSIFGGYPYCFTVWEAGDFTDKAFRVGDWFVQNPSGGTYTDSWCDQNSVKPIALLPPHTAPLDMKFGLGTDSNLYAALHGSWNRQPPQGYKVTYTPGTFSSTGQWSPTVDLPGTKTSYVNLLTNRDENSCNSGCFRPVGIVFNPTGENLYVTSDTSGEVIMVKRNAGPVYNPGTGTTTIGPTITPTPTTTTTITTPTTPTTTIPNAPQQTLYGQCGGIGYSGPTQCVAGAVCKVTNQYYSQCVPG